MRTVTFTFNATTGKLAQTGVVFAGNIVSFSFAASNSAALDQAMEYTITIKPAGDFVGAAWISQTVLAAELFAGTIVASVNLNVTAILTALGNKTAIPMMVDLEGSKTGDKTTFGAHWNTQIFNPPRRSTDTQPANPATNTYTDAQIELRLGTHLSTTAATSLASYTRGRNVVVVNGAHNCTLPAAAGVTKASFVFIIRTALAFSVLRGAVGDTVNDSAEDISVPAGLEGYGFELFLEVSSVNWVTFVPVNVP